jgi:cytidylate kinase
MIIAMDGPAGSGKSTVARRLAEKLGIAYLDTGATYRALTLKALADKLDLNDQSALTLLAKRVKIKMEPAKIFLDGQDVTKEIRTPQIDKNISPIVAHPQVRQVMVDLQRQIAQTGDFVVEGRDTTTVVFPQAKFKFYLDADCSVRAQRRYQELKNKGSTISWDEVKADLEKRDFADRNRKTGPLLVSPHAIVVDTTGLTIDQVVEKLAARVKNNKN